MNEPPNDGPGGPIPNPPAPVNGEEHDRMDVDAQDAAAELIEQLDDMPQLDAAQRQPAATEADRTEAVDTAKALHKVVDTYSGKSDPQQFGRGLAFQVRLRDRCRSGQALALLLLMFLAPDPVRLINKSFAPNDLLTGTVPPVLIMERLMSTYGRAEQLTDDEARHRLQNLRPRRSKSGNLDIPGFVQAFQHILARTPTRPDDHTLIYWMRSALPAALRSACCSDGNHKAWTSFTAFTNYLLTQASVAFNGRLSQPDTRDDDYGDAGPPTKRARNAHKNAGARAAVPNNQKPSFVPGLSKEEHTARKKSGACYKCGKPGHKAADCKSPK
jgi:Zinc knuckle